MTFTAYDKDYLTLAESNSLKDLLNALAARYGSVDNNFKTPEIKYIELSVPRFTTMVQLSKTLVDEFLNDLEIAIEQARQDYSNEDSYAGNSFISHVL
jgi:hypothetical protein